MNKSRNFKRTVLVTGLSAILAASSGCHFSLGYHRVVKTQVGYDATGTIAPITTTISTTESNYGFGSSEAMHESISPIASKTKTEQSSSNGFADLGEYVIDLVCSPFIGIAKGVKNVYEEISDTFKAQV